MENKMIQEGLPTGWAGRKIEYFEVIDSTNIYARKIAQEGAAHGTLVIADMQECGKGRRGRSWQTPPKTAVAMSLVLRPELAPERASMLTLVMGLAVARACRELFPELDAKIKWPNDIVVDGQKICGILTEMRADVKKIEYVVIGCGINVNMTEFPEEIAGVATSLALKLGHPVDRTELIICCMRHFERCYDTFMKNGDLSGLLEEYNQLLVNRGCEVRVLEPNHEYWAVAGGINSSGELLVTREDGTTEAVYAGEVSVRGILGYV